MLIISTLIILYALADTIAIPTGCFVATWIWLIVYVICAAVKTLEHKGE